MEREILEKLSLICGERQIRIDLSTDGDSWCAAEIDDGNFTGLYAIESDPIQAVRSLLGAMAGAYVGVGA